MFLCIAGLITHEPPALPLRELVLSRRLAGVSLHDENRAQFGIRLLFLEYALPVVCMRELG